MSIFDRHTLFRRRGRPPETLFPAECTRIAVWLLLAITLARLPSVNAQASLIIPTQTVSLAAIPTLVTLPPINTTLPVLHVSVPPSARLYLTLNICSLTSNSSIVPTVLVSTASEPQWALGNRPISDQASGGTQEGGFNGRSRQGGLWHVTWDKGFGNWTTVESTPVKLLIGLGLLLDGSVHRTVVAGNVVVQLGVSSSSPLHKLSIHSPLLGDTTSSSALIFSHLLRHSPHHQPTYPNYTLPPAQLPLLASDGYQSNLTLIMVPTGSSPTNDGLDNSFCAVRTANMSTGGIASPRNLVLNRTEPSWMAVSGEGFRCTWGVGDLVPGSNYTAWTLDGVELSRPIWLATKEAGFSCQIVRPSAICPSLAYAAPLLAAPEPNGILTELPANITAYLTSTLNGFSTSLLSSACGRDQYSYVSSCADCYAAYRDWLCRIVVPRCAGNSGDAQTVQRTPDEPRLKGMVDFPAYTELLPCLSTCNAVDRACPVNLNFRCPLRRQGVRSYAFVGDREDRGDGADPATPAADRWGNAWCNG